MKSTRTLNWVIAGCTATCIAALLALTPATRGTGGLAAKTRLASGATDGNASRLVAANSLQRGSTIPRYEQLPLSFEPTAANSKGNAKFLARGSGYALFLTPSETVLALGKSSTKSAALRLKMIGANPAPQFVASDKLPGKSNYIEGASPKNWRTNVPNYRRVTERSVYNGVDVAYYGNQRQLEYDFMVATGVDPDVIRVSFEGAENLTTNAAGDLIVGVAGDEIAMHKPVAYQMVDGAKHSVGASYVLRGSRSVGFRLTDYDRKLPIVIDPTLAYSTYLGGSNIDGANAIAVAPDNTAFITGGTFSANFPTAHPLQPNVGGPFDFPQDAFVAKISADGATLLYSTYLGGKNQDVGNGIAVDTFGNAFVTGTTLSPDFPVTPGALNTLCGSDGKCGASFNQDALIVSNAFVTKLNAAGTGLIYSTFLGEYENTRAQAIAIDSDENAYVTGQVETNGVSTFVPPPTVPPAPFLITSTAAQPAFGGGTEDAFLTKISASGNTVQYSTYLGGADEDGGYGIAVDSNAVAYVTGLTYSANFPTVAPLQGAANQAGDAFVAKINTRAAGAASLVFSTYIGGSGLDQGNAIAVDVNGNIYVAGVTASNSFPFTPNGFQTTNHGEGDAFVAKITPANALGYFTFLGGALADSGTGIAVDAAGNAYVTGTTVSTDFPVTTPTFQHAYGGGNADAFVTKLSPTGATLLYSSFLGGSNTELAGGIAVDTGGNAYVAGQTCSQDFPLSNPLQQTPGGNCDAFISKVSPQGGIAINPAGLVFAPQTVNSVSQSQVVTLTNNDVSPINVSSIVLSANNINDFVETNTCAAAIPAGGQCAINVTFHASAVGPSSGSLRISDSAPGSPQTIQLNGTGTVQAPDFTISTAMSNATVSAGDSATYNLAISPLSGFSQPISLSCAGLPRNASCSLPANAITPAGAPVPVTITVNTGLRTFVVPTPREFTWPGTSHDFGKAPLLALIVSMIIAMIATLRRRPGTAILSLTLMLLLFAAACSSGQSGVPAGTPAGTSQFTVIGTSGSLTHSVTLTLNVK